MSISLKEIRLLSEKYKCNLDCSECEFLKSCENIHDTHYRYKLDDIIVSKKNGETSLDSLEYIVFPKFNNIREDVCKKLIELLYSIAHLNRYYGKCTAEDLAKCLNVPIINIYRRISYIQEKSLMTLILHGNSITISLPTNNSLSNSKYDALMNQYKSCFKLKYQDSVQLDSLDYIVARSFSKKTHYSSSHIKILVEEYFNLNNSFLKNTRHKLKNFPKSIDTILSLKKNLFKEEELASISKEDLDKYLEGKREGKWTGLESWAKEYEEALEKVH